MKAGPLLVDGGVACVGIGVVLAFALRGRRQPMLLALFCVANLAAGAGNMMARNWWLGSGNLIAAAYFAGLWWRAERDRRSGGPPWLRDALAADARKRAEAEERTAARSAPRMTRPRKDSRAGGTRHG